MMQRGMLHLKIIFSVLLLVLVLIGSGCFIPMTSEPPKWSPPPKGCCVMGNGCADDITSVNCVGGNWYQSQTCAGVGYTTKICLLTSATATQYGIRQNYTDGEKGCHNNVLYQCNASINQFNKIQDCTLTGQTCNSATGQCEGAIVRTPPKLGVGAPHSCAIAADNTVKCWGQNTMGQLGDGTTTNKNIPVTVSGITTAVSIGVGGSHSCAVLSNGSILCWGSSSSGQLGDGSSGSYKTKPVKAVGIDNAKTVSGGDWHSCALLIDGSVKCWGANGYGELGDGTTTQRNTPVTVLEISNAVAVAVGMYYSCAILSDGTVKCWGLNSQGQLGNGSSSSGPNPTPVSVVGISNAIGLSVDGSHSCAILSDGTVKCWGRNVYGELGDGTTNTATNPRLIPTNAVVGITNAATIELGSQYSCALLADGAIKCWGNNYHGLLGNGSSSNGPNPTPVSVVGISNAIEVTAGGSHTCAMLNDGSVKCWGDNQFGQLGNGSFGSWSLVPINVAFCMIRCSSDLDCAVNQVCQNPGQCSTSACVPCTPACSSDDNCAANEICQNPGQCARDQPQAACVPCTPVCDNGAVCSNGNYCIYRLHCKSCCPACDEVADCNDGNANTLDKCLGAGVSCSAKCENMDWSATLALSFEDGCSNCYITDWAYTTTDDRYKAYAAGPAIEDDCIAGGCYYYDVGGRRITLPSYTYRTDLKVTNEVSVEAWVKPDANDFADYPTPWIVSGINVEYMSGCGDENMPLMVYGLTLSASGPQFRLKGVNDYTILEAPVSVPSNNWTHLVGTYKNIGGVGVAKLYVNGGLAASQDLTIGSLVTTSGSCYSLDRGHIADGYQYSLHFDGWIDEVKIYKRELSASEVLLRYQQFA